MYTAIKNYCNNGNNNGLFLLDMSTGYGKTYSVLKYIYEASLDESNSKKRYSRTQQSKNGIAKGYTA